jgi:hypothetical protein
MKPNPETVKKFEEIDSTWSLLGTPTGYIIQVICRTTGKPYHQERVNSVDQRELLTGFDRAVEAARGKDKPMTAAQAATQTKIAEVVSQKDSEIDALKRQLAELQKTAAQPKK